jgi:ankyrin repeat protein
MDVETHDAPVIDDADAKEITEALKHDDLPRLEAIITKPGFQINASLPTKHSILGLACYLDRYGIVEFLLSPRVGANPSFMPKSGIPPLQSAVAFAREEVVELLIKSGADVTQARTLRL